MIVVITALLLSNPEIILIITATFAYMVFPLGIRNFVEEKHFYDRIVAELRAAGNDEIKICEIENRFDMDLSEFKNKVSQ